MVPLFRAVVKFCSTNRLVTNNRNFYCRSLMFTILLTFRALQKLNEKKQVFNTYKQQKANEEREEHRMKVCYTPFCFLDIFSFSLRISFYFLHEKVVYIDIHNMLDYLRCFCLLP